MVGDFILRENRNRFGGMDQAVIHQQVQSLQAKLRQTLHLTINVAKP